MGKKSQQKPSGNTKSDGKTIPQNQLYCWFFTYNNPDEPEKPEKLANFLKEFCKKFYFQLEKGEKCGTLHFQGVFSLKIKEYFATVSNILGKQFHIEPVEKWFKAVNYCAKSETRIAGPWDHESTFIKTITNLFPVQQSILNIILNARKNNETRYILWFWEPIGNIGKSELVLYLGVHHKALLLNNACSKDIAFSIDNQEIVVFDFPRLAEDRTNYTAMEQLTNGWIFSGKYESKTKMFNKPIVVAFANWPPNIESMSKDRWKIYQCPSRNEPPILTHIEYLENNW